MSKHEGDEETERECKSILIIEEVRVSQGLTIDK